MKSSTRYTLLAILVVVFAIAAPSLILYVSGRKLNLDDGRTSATGILDAKTNPTGVMLSIDGKDHSTTPAIARFLTQGEYNVTLHKDGYLDWSKRLPIESGQVTFAQEGVTEIQMIKTPISRVLINSGVASFVLVDGNIVFTRDENLVYAPLSNPSQQTNIALGFRPSGLTILRDKEHVYLGNNKVFDASQKIIVELPKFQNNFYNPSDITVTPNGVFIFLANNGLNAFDPSNKKNTLLRTDVKGFTMTGNNGYFIVSNGNTNDINTALWNGTEFRDPQVVSSNVQAKNLYITDNKELFCDCNNGFARVNSTIENLGPKSNVHLDLSTNELAFLTNGNELQFYNFLTSRPQLLTRGNLNSQTNFLVRSSIGYGFVGNENGLEAIEIDSRDHQNRYQLIKGKQVWQLAMTDNQKTILALVDGSIVAIDIRN